MAMLCVNPGRLKALEYALRGAFSTCALLSIGGLPLPYGLPYGLLTRGCPWGGAAYSVRPFRGGGSVGGGCMVRVSAEAVW